MDSECPGDDQHREFEKLKAENAHLLDELEMAYLQMEKTLAAADQETQIAYDEVRSKNETLQRQLAELEKAYAQLQEAQSMLLRSERMSAMGHLAATIVREIKNPLAIISGHVGMMLMKGHEKVERAELESIFQAVWHLDELAENILSFSRKQPPESQALDLNSLAGEVVAFFMPLIKKRIG